MLRLILIISVIGLVGMACQHTSADDETMDTAESVFAEGYYAAAQNICDDMTADTDMRSIPVATRCRLALLYMKLAEQCNETENTASAIQCYRTALTDAPDTARMAFTNLPVEDMQYAVILSSLMSYAEGDSLVIHDHEGDSLLTDECNHIH